MGRVQSALAGRGKSDVLILGSFPGPFFARFSRRAVDEKADVVAGVLRATHVVLGVGAVRNSALAALKGRNTGRSDGRCMVRWVVVTALCGCWC